MLKPTLNSFFEERLFNHWKWVEIQPVHWMICEWHGVRCFVNYKSIRNIRLKLILLEEFLQAVWHAPKRVTRVSTFRF